MSKPILEANAVVPLYRQLMEKLQKEITSGILKPGDRLLPEVEMAKYYQVSVITARKAMDELAAQGLIEKRQGKGTFVTSPKFKASLNPVLHAGLNQAPGCCRRKSLLQSPVFWRVLAWMRIPRL